jgi:hypothetical protein
VVLERQKREDRKKFTEKERQKLGLKGAGLNSNSKKKEKK